MSKVIKLANSKKSSIEEQETEVANEISIQEQETKVANEISIQEKEKELTKETADNNSFKKTEVYKFKENNEDIDFELLDKMTDDEAIMELDKITGKNDSVLENDYLAALIEQEDRLVYYEVENIYSNASKKAYKGRLKLRREPPSLIMRDDLDNEAIFYLTENLTDELIETLSQVKRAYYGYNGPAESDIPKKLLDKIKYYVKKDPLKVSITALIVITFIIIATTNLN